MKESLIGMDDFLQAMHKLDGEIRRLLEKSNLTSMEKAFILEHILVVPGQDVNRAAADWLNRE